MAAKDEDHQRPGRAKSALLASQLRPASMRLPVPWLEHQFMFSAFVIADQDQVRQIAALGLKTFYCGPACCCRAPPCPKLAEAPPPTRRVKPKTPAWPEPARRPDDGKTARTEATERALRGRLDQAQKHYAGAAKAVGAAKTFDANPEESVRQVSEVSRLSTAADFADPTAPSSSSPKKPRPTATPPICCRS